MDLKIPAPRKNEENWVYVPIVRVGRFIPFGYEQDPNDKHVLNPIEEELELLEQAKEYRLKGYSLREVAAWLSEHSGRYISHQGLKDRIDAEQKRARTGTIQRQLAKELEIALKKAERIEASTLGKKERKDTSPTEA